MSPGELLQLSAPLLISVVLGALIGVERTVAHKRAGMRTYGLVSLGAALFVVVSKMITEQFVGITAFDPLRVASQVVVGVGFLGGGLIIFHHSKLEGLTTAAGLWVAAGIGLASGFGLYYLAVLAAVICLLVLTIFWPLERLLERWFHGGALDEDS